MAGSVAVILGSAFAAPALAGRTLHPVRFETPFGPATLYRCPRAGGAPDAGAPDAGAPDAGAPDAGAPDAGAPDAGAPDAGAPDAGAPDAGAPDAGVPDAGAPDARDAWVLFRHGTPHRFLPNQIPYRAHAAALAAAGVGALLVTSAVAALDRALPLDAPLLLADLLMPENRLPDGSTCTMFPTPTPGQAHLVLEDGLFSSALSEQVGALAAAVGQPVAGRAVFLYAGGPRSKSAAENAFWARLGAQVNSMTVGPEVVLANELGVPVAGLGVAHKYSAPGLRERLARPEIDAALAIGRAVVERIALAFLDRGAPVPFANQLYRYGDPT